MKLYYESLKLKSLNEYYSVLISDTSPNICNEWSKFRKTKRTTMYSGAMNVVNAASVY